MKRIFLALLVTTVTATWLGCAVETPAPVAQSPATSGDSSPEPGDTVDGEFTFVKLSVPNMT